MDDVNDIQKQLAVACKSGDLDTVKVQIRRLTKVAKCSLSEFEFLPVYDPLEAARKGLFKAKLKPFFFKDFQIHNLSIKLRPENCFCI